MAQIINNLSTKQKKRHTIEVVNYTANWIQSTNEYNNLRLHFYSANIVLNTCSSSVAKYDLVVKESVG